LAGGGQEVRSFRDGQRRSHARRGILGQCKLGTDHGDKPKCYESKCWQCESGCEVESRSMKGSLRKHKGDQVRG